MDRFLVVLTLHSYVIVVENHENGIENGMNTYTV